MKRLSILFTSLAFLLSGCSSSDAFKTMTSQEAKEIMDTKTGYVIVDVRTQEEYDQGHIPGAISIPNETINNKKLSELKNLDQMILVYCRSGNRSRQAAKKLADIGYTNVIDFGGIISWTGDITK